MTPEDVRLAVRAVVVHTAEEWPNGPLCRNDGASYPCRLHRWGRRVLENHGLNERQIDALIRHGNPFVHVPFPFTYTRPGPARPRRGPPRRPATRPVARSAGPAHPGRGPHFGAAARGALRRAGPAGGAPRRRAALAPGELSGQARPHARPGCARRRPGPDDPRPGRTGVVQCAGQRLTPQSGAAQLVRFVDVSRLFSRRESTWTWSSWPA